MNYFYDVLASFLILLVFGIIFLGLALSAMAKQIKQNWPKYKCNPMIMPIAGSFGVDAGQNFVECIGEIQSGFMGLFLAPIRLVLSHLGNIGGEIMNSMNFLRKLLERVMGSLMDLLQGVFGIIFNVIIRFQLLLINIKDLMMKILGLFLLIGYFIGGGTLTVQSIANGPIGVMVEMFGCFPKNTPIKLLNGTIKNMSELNLGDVLENNSTVHAVLKVRGSEKNPYYKIWSKTLNKFILVTGDHLIQHPLTKKFIKVETFEFAEKTNLWDNEMSSLVTTNNNIPIGEYTFWDWED